MNKIIIFGLGSIGQRHARILLKRKDVDLYAFRSKRAKKKNALGIPEITSWKDVKTLHPQIAFITNPTHLHLSTAIKCAALGMDLFIEKPLDGSLKQLLPFKNRIKKYKNAVYIAYVLRFHPVIIELKKMLHKYPMLHMRVMASSYAPGWRPKKSFKSLYSASRKQGGGVILDLSHELDYIHYLTGGILNMSGQYGRRGDITIDAEDYADILMTTPLGPVNLHIDYLSRKTQRFIQVDFEKFSIEADLINFTIHRFSTKKTQDKRFPGTMDRCYSQQIDFFMKHRRTPLSNLEEAAELLRRILKFKRIAK